jgi:diacylglycerol kinase family enzyme
VVANVASGGVSPDAPEELERIFADFGIPAHVCAPQTEDLSNCLRAAIDARPDLLVVLAGDGTVRAAAELCGADGPMIAPLPGGTMNLLPRAAYGARSWQSALSVALAQGEPQSWGGGEVDGKRFLCGAILGAPALWQPAREAVRYREFRQALAQARRAFKRAFTGRLRYAVDSGPRRKAGALSFICPVISRALPDEAPALEVAGLELTGASDLLGLGAHALIDDWRNAAAVEAERCQLTRVWSANAIPAILDGESVLLPPAVEVRYRGDMVKVLALAKDARG